MATGASYPFEATDQNGVERLAGTLTFTDDNDQPVPSTGTGTETADGASVVTIVDQETGALTWETDGGDALLSYTDPAAPTVIEAGTYCISATAVAATALTSGGYFEATLSLGEVASSRVVSPAATAVLTSPSAFLSVTAELPAGTSVTMVVGNASGASEDFTLDRATICKLA